MRTDVAMRSLTALALSAVLVGTATPGRAAERAKPSPEQIAQIEAFSHSLAVQAATYAAPMVAMYNLRETISFGAKPKAAPGQLWRMENITTPQLASESGYVTPNFNTIYGFGFFDLAREPVILTVPNSHDRYYMVEIVDMWSNAFAYAGGVATGYKGGTFALVGPGWQGELPAGVKRIDSPTRWVELQPRVHIKNAADLPGAVKVLDEITVKGLAEYMGKPAPVPVSYDYPVPKINPHIASAEMVFDDPLQFWEIFLRNDE